MSDAEKLLRGIDRTIANLVRGRKTGFLGKDRGPNVTKPAQIAATVLWEVRKLEERRMEIERRKRSGRNTRMWVRLRYEVLVERGGRCECCGATAADGKRMHVDHIKPFSTHPELEFDRSNLQVLCQDCNIGKSNVDQTDWRSESKN